VDTDNNNSKKSLMTVYEVWNGYQSSLFGHTILPPLAGDLQNGESSR
jgi:hypothetical protein